MSIRYHAEPADQLRIVSLGLIDAIYHRRAGATHLVAAPVPQIIDCLLAEGPADLAGLLSRLATRFDLGEAWDDARDALQARLDELAELGLVRIERAGAD